MFYNFWEGPRTWKYAVPWAVDVLLIPPIAWTITDPDPSSQILAIVLLGFAVLFFAVGLVNAWAKITQISEDRFQQHQEALSTTPLVLLANSMKQMHPDAVKTLNRFGVRTSWDVKLVANLGQRDWLLQGTSVHFGFVEFVLSRSGRALYPKERFSEGSKKWDPDGLVSDRQQYDELELWLFSRLMVTRSHGPFKPAEFIPPWTPEGVLDVMGLTGEQDLYRPDDSVLNGVVVNGTGKPAANAQNDDQVELSPVNRAAIDAVKADITRSH